MSKYIDADRLKAEIEKPKNELKVGNYYLDNSEQAVGYENALIDFELLIDSLQQEQPPLSSNLNEAAEEYLEQYNESEFGNGGDDWDDDIRITFKAGAEWMARQMKQEQSEVDLEKETKSWILNECGPSDFSPFADHWCADDIMATARHFYELGLKARKEK